MFFAVLNFTSLIVFATDMWGKDQIYMYKGFFFSFCNFMWKFLFGPVEQSQNLGHLAVVTFHIYEVSKA